MTISFTKASIMNGLMTWASSQDQAVAFSKSMLTRVACGQNDVPNFWNGSSVNKIITVKFPQKFGPKLPLDLNNTTILGGMCLLNTSEMKRISKREITFNSVGDFEVWYRSWHPRIDQIHDAVGVPPNCCKKIVYVSEDSFFADRLSDYTGFNRECVQSVLKDVHASQGHPALTRYLKCMGYKGETSVVYTSDISGELSLSLRIWERMLNQTFRACDRSFAKVELMYTGFWLDILGITSSGVIYEAASKMILKGWLKLESWIEEHPYGHGINKNLGIAGYLPFLTTRGDGSVLRFDEVPNYQNHKTYTVTSEDLPWYIVNLLFMKKSVIENGPLDLTSQNAIELIASDLSQYYG